MNVFENLGELEHILQNYGRKTLHTILIYTNLIAGVILATGLALAIYRLFKRAFVHVLGALSCTYVCHRNIRIDMV